MDNKNLTFIQKITIFLLVAIIVLWFSHSLLGWIGVEGNLIWFVLNACFASVTIAGLIFSILLFAKAIFPNKESDQLSFVIGIINIVLYSLNGIYWISDMFVNLFGLFK